MSQTHIEFISLDNKTKLVGTFWESNPNNPWILWIHGFAEHRLRYNEFANYLNQNKINFFCFDLRGHGDSSGKRGLILDFNDYLDDVESAIKEISKKTKEIFIAGHSMGGLILGRFLETRKPDISHQSIDFYLSIYGVRCSCSSLEKKNGRIISKTISRIIPSFWSGS
ncbi:MAG: hypothetical protein KatS3mg129_0350 [Leptospiraceae bacterium]|nr:MAG: hypothetical protein KatS3mg129_0350 [Leptospiraceae bacterium]